MDKQRHKKMMTTQARMRLEYETNFVSFLKRPLLNIGYFSILKDRLYGTEPTIRSFFSYEVYNRLASKSRNNRCQDAKSRHFFRVQLPLLLEIVISVQYYHNHVLDKKFGVEAGNKAMRHLLEANILRSALNEYVRTCTPPLFVFEIEDAINKMFYYVDVGQSVEKEVCDFSNWNSLSAKAHAFSLVVEELVEAECIEVCLEAVKQTVPNIPKDKEPFIRQYFQKTFLTNAGIYVLASELIAELLGVDSKAAKRFGAYFGLMRQLINDVSDLIPSYAAIDTKTRLAVDAFSDLRNDNLTLPIVLTILQAPEGEMAVFLKNPKWEKEMESGFYREALTSFAVFQAMGIGRLIKAKAMQEAGDENDMFKDMCRVADTNKFYRFIDQERKLKKLYKKQTKGVTVLPAQQFIPREESSFQPTTWNIVRQKIIGWTLIIKSNWADFWTESTQNLYFLALTL